MFIDIKVDVVQELWCLCYGVLAKSAPAHEGTEKCLSAVTTNHPENI